MLSGIATGAAGRHKTPVKGKHHEQDYSGNSFSNARRHGFRHGYAFWTLNDTIVELENGQVAAQSTLESIPHQQGGCMAPVQYLASHGVNALLAGGMGMRPLMGFNQMGISVYFAGNQPTVGMAITGILPGQTDGIHPEHTCGGGH